MTPSKQIPLTGGFSSPSEKTRVVIPPISTLVTHSPSLTGLQDSDQYRAKRLPVSIIVSGQRTTIRFNAVSTEVKRPLSILAALFLLVAHESNPIGEFMSWVTNVLSRATK